MEKIRQTILLIFAITSFIIAIYKWIKCAINKARAKRLGEEVDKETVEHDKILRLISGLIPNAMQYAEKNGGSGETKKLLAMSKLMLDCNYMDINFSKYQALIDETIEKFVELTRNVNTDKSEVHNGEWK